MQIKRRWLRRTVMVLASPHILYFYIKNAMIQMCLDFKGAWNA